MGWIFLNLAFVFIAARIQRDRATKLEKAWGHFSGTWIMLILWISFYAWLIRFCPAFPSHPIEMLLGVSDD